MSSEWKNLSAFKGRKNIVLEVGEGSSSLGFKQKILMFEWIQVYSSNPSQLQVKVHPSANGYYQTVNNFLVRIANKEEAVKVRDQFERKVLDNLRTSLAHDFMIATEVDLFQNGKKKVHKPNYESCLESHFYRFQESVKQKGKVALRNKNGKFGESILKFGYGQSKKNKEKAIVSLDGILAPAYVALLSDFKEHKLLGKVATYGKAVHYKRLSNAWAMHPLVGNLVVDLSRKIVSFARKDLYKFWDIKEQELKAILNKQDVKIAREVLQRNEKIFKGLIEAAYRDLSKGEVDNVFNLFMNGIAKHINNPYAFKTNWLINKGIKDEYDDYEQHGEIKDYQIGHNARYLKDDSNKKF